MHEVFKVVVMVKSQSMLRLEVKLWMNCVTRSTALARASGECHAQFYK
jgi:hypothetical protein